MKPVLVISERDNVATALEPLEAGHTIDLGTVAIRLAEPIPHGHKVALTRIHQGEPVIKYGSPIGTASVDIEVGTHVHTHNVVSSRGRGDLEIPVVGAQPRLAEPPDDSTTRNGAPALKPRS